MAKEKYQYNPHTLRYEKVKNSKKQLVFRILTGLFIIGALTMAVYFLAVGDSSAQRMQEQELAEMKKRYEDMNAQLDLMQKAMENLHERDAAIYNQILELDPTDEGFWNGGRGGSDKYEELKGLSDEELLIELSERMSKMRQRLALIAKAQEAILVAAKEKEEMLQALPSIRPIQRLGRKLEYLSGFGYRKHPVFKILKMHTGIDFGAPTGTTVHATGNGKVVRVEFKKDGYGRNIVIDHGYEYQTLYAHLSKVEVKVGEKIKRGQIIGRVGSTGTSTAPHLHYEVIYKKKKINPLPFCRDGMTLDEYRQFVDNVGKQNQALSIH